MRRKLLRHLVFAVHDKDALRLRVKHAHPFSQLVHVRVTTDSRKVLDLRLHLDRLAEELHFLRPV